MNLNLEKALRDISLIIEQDKKSSTYKFALLRGTIEIINENSPFIYESKGLFYIPFGALIEKWILYYYPIFDNELKIKQTNNNTLSFQTELLNVITEYKDVGRFDKFYKDFVFKGLSEKGQYLIVPLIKKLKSTITGQPMKHAGFSIYQKHYSIFNKDLCTLSLPKKISTSSDFTNNCGFYSIPKDYYIAFKTLGGLLTGRNSLLFNWALFSASSDENISISQAISPLLYNSEIERKTNHVREQLESYKKENKKLFCVWSGNEVSNFEVDHLFPFSYWSNNDYWNLLPVQKSVNNSKLDKIVTENQIEKSKDLILNYWNWYFEKNELGFKSSFQKNLLGEFPKKDWKERGIDRIKYLSKYYINERGYQPWEI